VQLQKNQVQAVLCLAIRYYKENTSLLGLAFRTVLAPPIQKAFQGQTTICKYTTHLLQPNFNSPNIDWKRGCDPGLRQRCSQHCQVGRSLSLPVFLPAPFRQRRAMCTPSSKAALTAKWRRMPLCLVWAPGTSRWAARWLPAQLGVRCCPLSSAFPAPSSPSHLKGNASQTARWMFLSLCFHFTLPGADGEVRLRQQNRRSQYFIT